MKTIFAVTLTVVGALFAAVAAQALTIELVTVGNAGNAAYHSTGDGKRGPFGAVDYTYRIGKYEVTNSEYAEFLNAVAGDDAHSLYDHFMGTDIRGGITQHGTSPNHTYSVRPDMANKPVNFMAFFDTLRFANWLHNDQPTGAQDNSTTEDGAYTLGGVTIPPNETISRNAGAKWFLTSEDEWFKSAFHQPESQGGDSDDYWLYPTMSNDPPAPATAIDTPGPTRGDASNPGPNVVNYATFAKWNGVTNFTSVGSTGSPSYYGTFDQGGNTWEWLDVMYEYAPAEKRVMRGGDSKQTLKHVGADHFHKGFVMDIEREYEEHPGRYKDADGHIPHDSTPTDRWGFRVATVIPEPGALSLFGLGMLITMAWTGTRKRR